MEKGWPIGIREAISSLGSLQEYPHKWGPPPFILYLSRPGPTPLIWSLNTIQIRLRALIQAKSEAGLNQITSRPVHDSRRGWGPSSHFFPCEYLISGSPLLPPIYFDIVRDERKHLLLSAWLDPKIPQNFLIVDSKT